MACLASCAGLLPIKSARGDQANSAPPAAVGVDRAPELGAAQGPGGAGARPRMSGRAATAIAGLSTAIPLLAGGIWGALRWDRAGPAEQVAFASVVGAAVVVGPASGLLAAGVGCAWCAMLEPALGLALFAGLGFADHALDERHSPLILFSVGVGLGLLAGLFTIGWTGHEVEQARAASARALEVRPLVGPGGKGAALAMRF